MDRDRLVHELLQIRESRALKLNHLEHEIITEAMCALSPCGFCRGLGYIVNPDDLKQVWCYCHDPSPLWSEEEMRHALPGGKP